MRRLRVKIIIFVFIFFTAVLLSLTGAGRKADVFASTGGAVRISLPYNAKEGTEKTYKTLYAVGGYHSVDNGAPAWGTSNYADIRLVGDRMGTLDVKYADGTIDKIPLVFGYTM